VKSRGYRVIIIGCGVAGLSAAIALRKAGHEPLVFERAPSLQPLGAGLILWSNAFAALRAIGLESEMLKIGAPLATLEVLTPSGSVLARTDARTISRKAGSPTLAVHRADLLEMLQRQVTDEFLHFDRTFTGFEIHDNNVIAHFEDGGQVDGDMLVGADGIWSTVRQQVHGSEAPRYAGYTAWRSVIRRERIGGKQTSTSTETWGSGTRFGWVPMSNDRVYWFAVKAARAGQEPGADGHKAELTRLFGDWHSPIPETIEASEESKILRHDIYDRPPISDWGRGPVTLAGDAAHPTTPNTGQGAAMALEDAVVLAHHLSERSSIETALREYEAQRYQRTTMVTNLSYRMGAVAQLENQIAVRVRNGLMWLLPNRLGEAQVSRITSWTPPRLQQVES
jgi:FAD-dependent urate hydroxylase